MTAALIIILIVIAGALAWLALQPGEFEVLRKKIIDAPPEKLFVTVRDFRTWKDWSAWLPHEPNATLVYSDNPTEEGGWYSWDGKRTARSLVP